MTRKILFKVLEIRIFLRFTQLNTFMNEQCISVTAPLLKISLSNVLKLISYNY